MRFCRIIRIVKFSAEVMLLRALVGGESAVAARFFW